MLTITLRGSCEFQENGAIKLTEPQTPTVSRTWSLNDNPSQKNTVHLACLLELFLLLLTVSRTPFFCFFFLKTNMYFQWPAGPNPKLRAAHQGQIKWGTQGFPEVGGGVRQRATALRWAGRRGQEHFLPRIAIFLAALPHNVSLP